MLSELWNDLSHRIRSLLHRAEVERELDEELRFHIERETEKYVSQGMSAEQAARRARLSFGGVERFKEEHRDARGLVFFDHFVQDLRYAARGLRAKPSFTLAVVLTLALGIGANAAMFGIVDRLIFRSPPYMRDAGTAHRVYLQVTVDDRASPGNTNTRTDRSTEFTRFRDIARWSHAFSNVSAFDSRKVAAGTGEESREIQIATVSATFFDFFDARPVIGRFFSLHEDAIPAGAPVAVLSNAYWRTRYGARADVLGETILLGAVPFTIIGVAPEHFVGLPGGAPPALFIPITSYAGLIRVTKRPGDYYSNYNWGWLSILVRRKAGVSIEAANADISAAYRQSYEAERVLSPGLTPMEKSKPRAQLGPVQANRGLGAGAETKVLRWVGGVALIVLLIACANVSNLQLARALQRRREIALRLALGVSRGRLIAQLLTESVLLGLVGGTAGVVVAHWGARMLRPFFLPEEPSLAVLGDGRTLLFAAGVAVITGILTGLAPALHAGRDDLATALKAGVREGTHQRSRMRTVLLVAQGALAVVLLVGAGLFARSLNNVRTMRLGYDVEPLLYVSRNARGMTFTDDEAEASAKRLRDEAAAIPGVEVAALALTVPFWDTWSDRLSVPGIDSVQKLGSFTLQAGSAEYFRASGTRILRGRGIEPADRRESALVAVVSEAMAAVLWPGKDPIGQCIRIGDHTSPCRTVVGIAENIKQNSLTEDRGLHYYMPIEQFNPSAAQLFIRVTGDASAMAETVRRRLQPLMPGNSYVTVTPMREIVDPAERAWRAGATMFGVFSSLALIVAAIGLYSVIAYDVAQRTHELGVRLALGARREDVVRIVVGAAMRFTAVGIAIGGTLALASGRWVAPMLFAVSPRDPMVFAVVIVTLVAVAMLASAVPAFRASRVDPSRALRNE